MKTNTYQRVPTQFAPDVAFDLQPVAALDRDLVRGLFEQLQNELVRQHLEGTRNPSLRAHLKHAANEAAAISWTTQYPLLVMPALFEEKARTTRLRVNRQVQIQQRSQQLTEAML
jgi:hypothetical protein